NARAPSPTSCSPPASTGAMISACRTASMSITGWPTTGSAWRALTCRISCPREQWPTRPKQRCNPRICRGELTSSLGVAEAQWRNKAAVRCIEPALSEGDNERRGVIMKRNTDEPKASESKPGSKAEPKDDLKSLPMPQLEKQLASSPEGLTEAEAKKRLAQYGP